MPEVHETAPLIEEGSAPAQRSGSSSKRRALLVGAAVCGLSALGALAVSASHSKSARGSAKNAKLNAHSSSTRDEYLSLIDATDKLHGMSVSNKYIASDGPDARPLYPWLGDGEAVLEPFRSTTFGVTSVGKPAKSYTWTIIRPSVEQNEYELDLKASRRSLLASKGLSREEIDHIEPEYDDGVVFQKTMTTHSQRNAVVHTFNELGKHTVVAKDDETGATLKTSVYVRYVRREMRTVDEEDHEALFKAWKVLLETSDEEGVDTYGSNFWSQARLSTEHNNLAGDRSCDHLHDGMGFIPAHMSVSRLLEASLQSVDSSVALPYWEYTMDVETIIAHHNGDFQHWRNIPAFTDKWFGKTNAKTGHIEGGLFSSWTLEANDYTVVSNSWGLIRAPWNNLKDPQVARYMGGGSALHSKPVVVVDADQMSSCESVFETLESAQSLADFNDAGGSQVHGAIHMFTGGQSNTLDMVPRLANIFNRGEARTPAELNQYWAAGVSFFDATVKRLYRYKLYHCPSSCSSSDSMESCMCTCDTAEIMDSTMMHLFKGRMKEWEEWGLDGKDTLEKMLNLLCDDYHNIVHGDHASSASASDPSFWFIHGPIERWLQAMLMNDYFTDESWVPAVFTNNIHPFTETCFGHHATDKLAFGEVDGNDFTNKQYFDYLNPTSNNLPYVYDNLKWDHCKVLGYDIEGLLTGSLDTSKTAKKFTGSDGRQIAFGWA
jgi:hypothetical protein